jgi:site-specific DNA-methyltransferase (adenine-specific)
MATLKILPALEPLVVSMESLVLDPKNARVHDDRNIDDIVSSLKKFGQMTPILIDANGVIRKGNGTYRAAERMGAKQIAAARADHLSEEQLAAYAITDNATGLSSTWDNNALGETLSYLEEMSFDVLDLGFTQAELSGFDFYQQGFVGDEDAENGYSGPYTDDVGPLDRMESQPDNQRVTPDNDNPSAQAPVSQEALKQDKQKNEAELARQQEIRRLELAEAMKVRDREAQQPEEVVPEESDVPARCHEGEIWGLGEIVKCPQCQSVSDCASGEECECASCGHTYIAAPVTKHKIMVGDCRDIALMRKLFGTDKINVAVTSPPYASQRKYDEESGFRPIAPKDYVSWFQAVQAGIMEFLALDGSYFLNIKEHSDNGERDLYVKDLTIAHRREWGWRFVDEFCWVKHSMRGYWPNRFKNEWEPVFHYCRQMSIKFFPKAVGHISEMCMADPVNTPRKIMPSGMTCETVPQPLTLGVALPGNVIKVESEKGFGYKHTAPYPVGLPAFFIKGFSEPGDMVYDPFLGTGTTLIAAEKNDRQCNGFELSPQYCDLILYRWESLTGGVAKLISPAP